MTRRFAFPAGVLATAVFAGLASMPATAAERQTFTIRQDAPVLAPVDIGVAGQTHGDMLAFEAPLTATDGTTGVLRGILITVDLPDADGDVHEDRIGQLYFDLGGGDTLVVAGGTVYPDQTAEMVTGKEQVRAVIGGTGKFIGARGQVTTLRDGGGTYDHRFELLE